MTQNLHIYYIHFYIKIRNHEYVLSTLKINLKSNQIYYRFNHQKCGSNSDLILLDHISCHINQTHLKTNSKSIVAKTEVCLLPPEGEATIILLQSFFLSADGFHLLQENINFSPKWKDSINPALNQEVLIGDLPEPINFSLILVLVPCNSNLESIIETCAITDKHGKERKLSSLRNQYFKIGLISAFPKHNILVFPTHYIHDSSVYNDGPFWKIFYPVFSEIMTPITKWPSQI